MKELPPYLRDLDLSTQISVISLMHDSREWRNFADDIYADESFVFSLQNAGDFWEHWKASMGTTEKLLDLCYQYEREDILEKIGEVYRLEDDNMPCEVVEPDDVTPYNQVETNQVEASQVETKHNIWNYVAISLAGILSGVVLSVMIKAF
jgi:hypothetical protein